MKIYFGLLAIMLTSTSLMAEKDSHSHDFSKEAVAFHDVMSPLWHAEKGPKRLSDTCAKITDMKQLAKQVKRADLLVTSVDALARVCEKEQAKFEETFHHLHEAFHRVIEAEKKHASH